MSSRLPGRFPGPRRPHIKCLQSDPAKGREESSLDHLLYQTSDCLLIARWPQRLLAQRSLPDQLYF